MKNYRFDEMRVGLRESFEVVITEEIMDDFRRVSGDVNALHSDERVAKEKGYPGRVVYGMLTASFLSTLGGVYLPGENCLIHSVEVNLVKPVFIGDQLLVQGTVFQVDEVFREVTLKVEIFNQAHKKVLFGKMKVGVLDE